MSALGHALARGLDVTSSTRIRAMRRSAGAWILEHEGGAEGPFDAVVLALPPVQAAALAPSLADRLAPATFHPCWAVLLTHARPLPLGFDGAFVENGPLSWIARDGSKPDRPAGERWVLHASPEWSATNLEEDPRTVAEALDGALAEATGRRLPDPVFREAHRWRYALPRAPLGVPFLSGENGLAACGDWCDGPRVEGAWRSGRALGVSLLRGLRDRD
jgi:predicted NAD/FAD-dependent oxidoreductase